MHNVYHHLHHSLPLIHLVSRLTYAVALTDSACPCSSVQFKPALSLGRSFLLHMHNSTTQRASVPRLGALSAVYLLIAAWLFTGSPQQQLPHPHLSCSSLLHQHPPPVTALHQGIDASVLAAIYSDTPPPRHCTPLVSSHPFTFLHPTHPQHGLLGDRWRRRRCFRR